MKYLKIKNKGLLDLRLIYLMGGTTKKDDEYKIGQFGTGLKYTLAFMIRNNIDFKIFIDCEEVKITSKSEIIRETNFDIIYINGERTSITSNMGIDWEAWMIIRELWCNALDEENPSNCITEEIIPESGHTEYYIQLIPEIQKVCDNWDKYFIQDKTPIMNTDDFAIYDGGDSLRCYKNGVLIKEIINKKSVFSYDFKKTPLNELREMKYTPQTEIAEVVPLFDRNTAEILIENIKNSYEESIDFCYSWSPEFGDGWKEAIGNSKFISENTYEKIIDRCPSLINEALVIVPGLLYKSISKWFPHVSIIRASDKLHEFFEIYSETLHDKTQKCLKLLEKAGYYIDPNLKIIYGVFGNKEIYAQVNLDDKEIRLSENLESLSEEKLIISLIEENEHFKTGFHDCTRAFQTHLLELYSNLLLKDVKVLI